MYQNSKVIFEGTLRVGEIDKYDGYLMRDEFRHT